MKLLLIRSPWIDLILEGAKTWEMRSRPTRIRGRIALARAGSGMIVATADLVDCLPVLTEQGLRENRGRHGIPEDRFEEVIANGWTTPWVLANIRPLATPSPYRHPNGAVTWVDIEGWQEPNELKPVDISPTFTLQKSYRSATQVNLSSQEFVDIKITQGNIRNSHFYLRSATKLLPTSCIGGSNRSKMGDTIRVNFVPGQSVETDVDGEKMILRARGPIRDFFAQVGIEAGDSIRFQRQGEYEYIVSFIS